MTVFFNDKFFFKIKKKDLAALQVETIQNRCQIVGWSYNGIQHDSKKD